MVVKRNGRFTTIEMEMAESRAEGYAPYPLINAKPDRMKICPVCLKNQPIAEFLIESSVLRTVIVKDVYAAPCAAVSEFCRSCET